MSVIRISNPIVILPGFELYTSLRQGLEEIQAEAERVLKDEPMGPKILNSSLFDPKRLTENTKLLGAALYLECLEGNCHWVRMFPAQARFDAAIEKLATVVGMEEGPSETFLQDIRRHLENPELTEFVHEHCNLLDGGRMNWQVWAIRPLGTDFLVEDTGDYRVLDWTRTQAQKGDDAKEILAEGGTVEQEADAVQFVSMLRTAQLDDLPVMMPKVTILKRGRNNGKRQ